MLLISGSFYSILKLLGEIFFLLHLLFNVIHFFDRRSTNASAESFNAKLKAFRAALRGVSDMKYFLFRVAKIYA